MRRAWSCWNFRREGSGSTTQPANVTYAMNLLQGLTTSKHYPVTLNRPGVYDEKKVIARMVYHHPTYTNASIGNTGLPANLKRSAKHLVLRQLFRLWFS